MPGGGPPSLGLSRGRRINDILATGMGSHCLSIIKVLPVSIPIRSLATHVPSRL